MMSHIVALGGEKQGCGHGIGYSPRWGFCESHPDTQIGTENKAMFSLRVLQFLIPTPSRLNNRDCSPIIIGGAVGMKSGQKK